MDAFGGACDIFAAMTEHTNLHARDFYGWTLAQADALRRRSANEIDWDHLAEELEAMGRSERRELFSRYVVLLTHLLKWGAQPSLRSRSWRLSVENAREAIVKLLAESPGLKSFEPSEFADAWRYARKAAAAETGLSLQSFPEVPCFTPEQAKHEDFWLGDDGTDR